MPHIWYETVLRPPELDQNNVAVWNALYDCDCNSVLMWFTDEFSGVNLSIVVVVVVYIWTFGVGDNQITILEDCISSLQDRSTYVSAWEMHLMSSLLLWIKMERCIQGTWKSQTFLVEEESTDV